MAHYFDNTPAVGSAPERFDVVLADTAFTIETDRGVFSHGHLDAGTRLLLQVAPTPPPSGNLLDLGSGAGSIALALARRAPGATVWAVDVNERARALTTANAQRNGVDNVRVAHPDDVPEDVSFDAIWSNPPIRIGKSALHELLIHWLSRLTPGGHAVLVVQKHLGADSLQRWLIGSGFPSDRIASRAGFRVLAVGAAPPAD